MPEIAAQLGVGKSQLYERLKSAAPSAPKAAPKPKKAIGPAPEDIDDLLEGAGTGSTDDLAILDRVIHRLETALANADPSKISPLSRSISELVRRRAVLRPPTAPTLEELEAKARPAASAVVDKITKAFASVAQIEADTGCCRRCSQQLPAALIEIRKAEARAGHDE